LASLVVVVGHPANAPVTGSAEQGLPVSPLVTSATVLRLLSVFPASL
jgi:hypothetical protein